MVAALLIRATAAATTSAVDAETEAILRAAIVVRNRELTYQVQVIPLVELPTIVVVLGTPAPLPLLLLPLIIWMITIWPVCLPLR
jgi:hypothetical protein